MPHALAVTRVTNALGSMVRDASALKPTGSRLCSRLRGFPALHSCVQNTGTSSRSHTLMKCGFPRSLQVSYDDKIVSGNRQIRRSRTRRGYRV